MQFPKLGISLRSLKRDGSDFSERVNEVSNYNPFSIELMGFAQDLIFNGNLNQQRIDILNQELERFSGKKTFHGPMVVNFLDKKDNLKDYEKLIQSYIDLTHKLNAEKIIIHTGFCDNDSEESLKQKYSIQRDYLKSIGDYAAERNVIICVENIFPFSHSYHTALPSKLSEEINTINHENVSACFDVSHAYICCNIYQADFLKNSMNLGGISDHWHIHDSFGKLNYDYLKATKSEALSLGNGDLHLAVGDGDIPWKQIISNTKIKSDTVFNIELNPELWFDLEKCVNSTLELIEFSKDKSISK